MRQQAVIVAMVGSSTTKKATDPSAVLNAIAFEGWELVNGGFVFVEEGQQSRDKFMSSGQNVATKGSVVGYYLFRRAPQNRRPEMPPPLQATWEQPPSADPMPSPLPISPPPTSPPPPYPPTYSQ
jgi:hypothetical protein